MSEATDSNEIVQETATPISNRRILWLMAAVAIFGSAATLIFVSGLFGLGFFIGGILAFLNYYWLKFSLKKMFVETAEGEHRPHYSAARFISRYFTLGAVLAIVFMTRTVPVESVVFGLSSFAFAILIEAFIRIFSFLFRREEI
jgi:hypothetical protein